MSGIVVLYLRVPAELRQRVDEAAKRYKGYGYLPRGAAQEWSLHVLANACDASEAGEREATRASEAAEVEATKGERKPRKARGRLRPSQLYRGRRR